MVKWFSQSGFTTYRALRRVCWQMFQAEISPLKIDTNETIVPSNNKQHLILTKPSLELKKKAIEI